MHYTGQFKNTNNKSYQVDIITNNDSTQSTPLTFSGEPFKIELNSDKNIYQPLKLSNATCGLVVNEYYFDIYSSTAQGTKLTLTNLDSNAIEWVGYVTPNVYTQPFEQELEELQIEAIDGLSTLENILYQTIDNDTRKIKSFEDILISCIQRCNCYSYIYVSKNNYLKSEIENNNVYDNVKLQYNDLGNSKYTSDPDYQKNYWWFEYYFINNGPVNSQKNITLKYNYTEYGINYNVVETFTIPKGQRKSNIITVHQYYVPDMSTLLITETLVDNYNGIIDDTKIIDKLFLSEELFFNNDLKAATATAPAVKETSMNYKEILTEMLQFLGYTIVAFGDSVYLLDYDHIKTFNTISNITNYDAYHSTNNWLTFTKSQENLYDMHNIDGNSFMKNGGTIELDQTYNLCSITTSETTISTLLPEFYNDDYLTNKTLSTSNWNDTINNASGDNTYVYKFYTNEKWKNIYYDNVNNWNVINNNLITPDILKNCVGSSFVRLGKYKTGDGVPATLSFDDYICLHSHLPANPSTAQNTTHPVLELNYKIPEAGYIYNDYYLVINGSATWADKIDAYVDESLKKDKDDTFIDTFKNGYGDYKLKLTAKLKIGDCYWDGNYWIKTDTTFPIFFDKKEETNLNYTEFNVKNTVKYSEFIGKDGQKIPIFAIDQIVGDVEFILYSPQNVMTPYVVDYVWLKNFSIDLIKPNKLKDDTNTQYVNIINEEYVNKFSDLTQKIISDTNKGLNYSVVITYPNDNIGFENCNKICTKTMEINQKPELNYIEKFINQYSTPRKKLNLTLENKYKPWSLFTIGYFQNEKYIVDKMSIDYYNDNNLLTIVEKA